MSAPPSSAPPWIHTLNAELDAFKDEVWSALAKLPNPLDRIVTGVRMSDQDEDGRFRLTFVTLPGATFSREFRTPRFHEERSRSDDFDWIDGDVVWDDESCSYLMRVGTDAGADDGWIALPGQERHH